MHAYIHTHIHTGVGAGHSGANLEMEIAHKKLDLAMAHNRGGKV